jgi:cysteine synthase
LISNVGPVLDMIASRSGDTSSARAGEVLDLLAERIASYPVTPIVTFDVQVEGRRRRIQLKLEGESPWRSIKGRTAIGLIASVAWRVTERSRLIESTSGNLGVALAALSRELGLAFTAVVDDLLPTQMRQRIHADGALLLPADGNFAGGDRLASRIRTVSRICAADPNVIWTNQYENAANPLIHEVWTGPELLTQVPDVQAIFVGVSTGGTLGGLARATRTAGRDVKVVGTDVEGSRVFGGRAGPRVLTGIGASKPSKHLDASMCDAVEVMSSWDGIVQCRDWKQVTGLCLGGSSGVVLAAALRHLAAHPDLTTVACVCPDLGDNYTETIYNDEWVRAQRSRLRDSRVRTDGPALRVELLDGTSELIA